MVVMAGQRVGAVLMECLMGGCLLSQVMVLVDGEVVCA
jgi:hypothetical protein